MRKILLIAAFLSLIFISCGRSSDNGALPHGASMYYWRTTFAPDSAERAFLSEHNVKRLYIRMFDVVKRYGNIQPNATIMFDDSVTLPVEEYVPVVFITNDVMTDTAHSGLHKDIIDRVIAMASTHRLPAPKELQIDCDWTSATRQTFFAFMDSLSAMAHQRGMKTSVTIRLHQLDSQPPVADYGVLMLYNTGDVRHPSKGHPILSHKTIQPYLRYLKGYELPLILALPNFNWPALYSSDAGGEFKGLLYGFDEQRDTAIFRPAGAGKWKAVSTARYNSTVGDIEDVVLVTPGMYLSVWAPPEFDEMQTIIDAVSNERPSITSGIILYDLQPSHLNIYTPQQYEKIFNS